MIELLIWAILWSILSWILTVSLQNHIFRTEVYFKKKEEAFKILQLIDILNYELIIISNSIKINKERVKNFDGKLNELRNIWIIYFPDFKENINQLLNTNKNSKKIIELSKILVINGSDEKIDVHNQTIINNLDNLQKEYNEFLETYRSNFINYLEKEERKLWFKK